MLYHLIPEAVPMKDSVSWVTDRQVLSENEHMDKFNCVSNAIYYLLLREV